MCERCFTVSPMCASPSTPRPATSVIVVPVGLVKVWSLVRLTEATMARVRSLAARRVVMREALQLTLAPASRRLNPNRDGGAGDDRTVVVGGAGGVGFEPFRRSRNQGWDQKNTVASRTGD